MDYLVLDGVSGIGSIRDTHYMLFPGIQGEQVTAVRMLVTAVAREFGMTYTLPYGADLCPLSVEFCEGVISCFPHTEPVVASLHSDECGADSSSESDGGKEIDRKQKGSGDHVARRVVWGVKGEESGKLICHQGDCRPGEEFRVFFGLTYPLLVHMEAHVQVARFLC